MKKIKPIADEFVKLEFEKFRRTIGDTADPTMLVLRGHLFTESLLERVIRLKLPRGDKLLESAALTYAQKLYLAEALETVSDPIAASLRGLNKLRNQCAHDLGRQILDADVIRLGSPLGKFFTSTHRQNRYDPIETLKQVLDYIIGHLTATCHIVEQAQISELQSGRTNSINNADADADADADNGSRGV